MSQVSSVGPDGEVENETLHSNDGANPARDHELESPYVSSTAATKVPLIEISSDLKPQRRPMPGGYEGSNGGEVLWRECKNMAK